MTFGERNDGTGGFSVSPGAIVNTVAATGMGALAWMVITLNADIATLKNEVIDDRRDLTRVEARIDPINTSVVSILSQVRGNTDGVDVCKATDGELNRQLREIDRKYGDLDRRVNDLDRLIAPPRIDHPR